MKILPVSCIITGLALTAGCSAAASPRADEIQGTTTANESVGSDAGTTASSSKFACSGAGIAAFADALVTATRSSCTSDGIGAVRNDNYQCVIGAINGLAPPYPGLAYRMVTTLLAPNQDYPNLECTYFVQMVTAGVCGAPVSPNDEKWTAYPLAHEFIGKAPDGYTWFDNDGSTRVQAGDIFVYDGSGEVDPGHIMIVAEVLGPGRFRIAEANELESDGSPAFEETGVMSNTRIAGLNGPEQAPAGWLRLNPR